MDVAYVPAGGCRHKAADAVPDHSRSVDFDCIVAVHVRLFGRVAKLRDVSPGLSKHATDEPTRRRPHQPIPADKIEAKPTDWFRRKLGSSRSSLDCCRLPPGYIAVAYIEVRTK